MAESWAWAIAQAMRAHRKAKGITQAELARIVGRFKQSVSAAESGKQEPRLHCLDEYATALGCSVADIVADAERLRTVMRRAARAKQTSKAGV